MKKREKICVFITYAFGGLELFFLILWGIYELFHLNKETDFWYYIYIIGFFVNGFLYLIFSGIVCEWAMSPIDRFKRSDKYQFRYENFDELYNDTNKKLVETGYSIKKEYKISDNEKLFIYMKPLKTKLLEMWLIADLNSYTKSKEEKIEKYIEEFYNEYIKTERSKKAELKSFKLLCVRRYTEELEKITKENYTDGLLNLTIALSFVTKEIYIASAKELRLINNSDYMDLKNEFFSVVDATKITKEKKNKVNQ